MKILGIDTSTKFLSIGVYDGRKVSEYNLELGRGMSSLISVAVQRVLNALGWQVGDMDYFACGIGPGSFTGTRIGVATVKGISWVTKRPVIGISSLDILAKQVKDADAQIITMVDAKRHLIYGAIYKNKDGILRKISKYLLLSKDDFLKRIKPGSVVLGDALVLYKEDILKNVRGVKALERDYWYPKGHNIIELAKEKIKQKKFMSAFSVTPIYLYPKECQVRR